MPLFPLFCRHASSSSLNSAAQLVAPATCRLLAQTADQDPDQDQARSGKDPTARLETNFETEQNWTPKHWTEPEQGRTGQSSAMAAE